ncbi:MAG TPA: GAF domain-containing sensor histidine kinase [Ktedonobacteraceae bacterium]|nr:GAF domain-containing sensor histidine kinase [Ktedonobacteraceae bacterium]
MYGCPVYYGYATKGSTVAILGEAQLKKVMGDKLTRAYLQKLGRQNYFATASAVVIVTFSFFWMLFHLAGSAKTELFANVMYPVSSLIGAFWAGLTAYRARNGPVRLAPKHQLAWLLISLGLLADGLGGAYYAYLGNPGPVPLPSPADIGFTLLYPLVGAGLLLMPTSLRFRTRMGLDALITALCFLGISWFFVVGPSYLLQRNQVPLAELITSLSYPCWDIVLILALVLLILRRSDPLLHPSLFILGLGILSDVWADSIFAYQNVFGVYNSGTAYVDPFWFICSLLIGLAGLYQYMSLTRRFYNLQMHPGQVYTLTDERKRQQESKSDRRFLFFRSALIYIPLTFLLVVMVYSEFMQGNEITRVLVMLTALVVLLVTIRYLFTSHENEVLLRDRQQSHEESELLRQLTAQMTDTLELEPLLELIMTMVTQELGFAAALLLILEGHANSTTRLVVRALASTSPTVSTWHLYGESLSRCTILLNKEIAVEIDDHPAAAAPLVHAWLQEQHVTTTLFVPLTYQGKNLGSLGFSRSKNQPLSLHDASIARSFTKQVANVFEHANLYRISREHEIFAQAMANISARLNAAVVDPQEIHQLICDEGANALNADYVLLYQTGDGGQLLPVAVYRSEGSDRSNYGAQQTNNHYDTRSIADWPPIASNEPEAEALTSLQPLLVHFNRPYALEQKALSLLPSPHFNVKTTASHVAIGATGSQSGQLSLSLRSRLVRENVETAILAPLIFRGDPVGLLIFGRSVSPGLPEKKSLTADDLLQVQDFTEQASVAFTNAHLYQELRIAHQQLQELDQLKDQFMITASHELRTPLTSVQGYIELIAQYDEQLPPDQRQEFLQKARRSCDELVLLLSNVMDASRLEIEAGIRPALMEPVDVQHALHNILDLIEPQITQEQREVYLDIPSGLIVQTDPARLRQVLLNISTNALKYSPAGTPLMFTARQVFDAIPCVNISITDKGNGIAPEEQTHLFERFVRLERDINSPVRGSGLGLYISRRLIEALGGKIWIESSGVPGEGSTFHLQLPMP